ncbi:acyl-CoA-binding protein [Phycicoccus sp. BSK3Z-2]|uniref:Acyl-CoA-binding protein n=1 Tax=Phycicoccus avicenniae TaxID=2828860 RepID=A0A941D999_9MICO|nr:acyl-CoA-binding protein [Phycicoccus avicenniae]MBR7744115.1 acyl-CoA-binding protein [Phycicoccus avicenniae]
MAASEDEFRAAVDGVSALTEDPGNLTKLRLYALYKQATEGDVTGDRPGALAMVARAKHDARSSVRGMSAEDARTEYVRTVEGLRG